MIALGVDCGKDRVHVVGDDWDFETRCKSGTPRDVSLQRMSQDLSLFLAKVRTHGPFRLYVEEPVVAGARNIRTTIGIAQTVGMVLSLGYPATLVPVSTWKKAVLGNGKATKEDVEEWYLSTGGTLVGQDYYDAAAISVYGQQDLDVSERLRRGLLTSEGS